MLQTKEQGEQLGEQLTDMKKGNLPEKEFRVITTKMIQELRKRMDAKNKKLQEFFFFFWIFLGPHIRHMEVPRLGSNQSCSCWPTRQPQ